ncbi:hypothetical protein [Magnetospirillum sp. UT-4]|uniref:hypothetical protein n=1 Tax=Magnetospirillum sp. UT-4 TaxID=2681467 RepID=UPI0013823EAC|nr:hypothetical protein [Magnetospirillum sp. UT-4]CAA7618656.1 conserved hypothetical protein [Magnetospirillum sp. UT-4]
MAEETTRQSDFLRKYYEVSWHFRWQWMKAFMASGRRHPLEVVKAFSGHERRNTLYFDDGYRTYLWKPRYPEAPGQELLPTGTPAFRDSSLRGHALTIPFHAGTVYSDFIVDYMATNGPFDLVAELGCGYGRNLFEIAYAGLAAPLRLVGGEFTATGCEATAAIAALDPALDMTVLRFDHTRPDLSQVAPGQRVLVFTCHSIEQVAAIDSGWIDAVTALGEQVTVIHLEPFGFQFDPDLGPVTRAHAHGCREKEWNLNLAQVLKREQARGRIRLSYLAAEIFLPLDAYNPTSVAIWHADKRT